MGDWGFGLQTNCARGSSAAEGPAKGSSRVGLCGRASTAHDEIKRPSKGLVLGKKGLKRKNVEQRGESYKALQRRLASARALLDL